MRRGGGGSCKSDALVKTHFATSVGAFHSVVAIVATEAAFLALARVPVVVLDGVHLHGRTAALLWTIHSVTATHAIVMPNTLVEIAPKIGVSGTLLVIVSTWHWSLPR